MGVTFNENTFVKLGPIFNENVGAVQIFHREAAMFSVNVNAVASNSLLNSDSFLFQPVSRVSKWGIKLLFRALWTHLK